LNFKDFSSQLGSFLSLDDKTLDEIWKKSRPRVVEDRSQHKRSGATGEHKSILTIETQKKLLIILHDSLSQFNYTS
jgi:hypothetical protein